MQIKYKFATGETVTIETNEYIGQEIKTLDRALHANDKRETRRHYSMCKATEDGIQYADTSPPPETQLLRHEELTALRRAMTELNTEQTQLVRSVFFNGKQLKELAQEYGITYQAIQNRLNKALTKLRKHFTEN